MTRRRAGRVRRNHRWTEEDFVVLREMTMAGATAKEVAVKIGASPGTVNVYRHKLRIVRPCDVCETCGKAITEQPRVGRKRRYCDDECIDIRQAAEEMNRRLDAAPKVCEQCKAVLPDNTRGIRYCNKACSSRAWYERAIRNPDIRSARRESRKRYGQRKRAA